MATVQIPADARLRAIRAAYDRNADGVIVVKEGENFDTIFNRTLSLANIDPKDVTDSQRTNFKNSFPAVRSEVYALTSKVKVGDQEVSGFEFLTKLNVKKQDMLKKLTSTHKDAVVSEGTLLPIPEGFSGSGSKGRKAINTMSYFDTL